MNDPRRTAIAARLRQARRTKYSNAAHAAEALEIPYPTYAAHDRGKTGLRAEVAERYAKFFGCDLEWLLTGHGLAPAEKSRGGNRIAEFRKRKGLTQAQLGPLVGLSPDTGWITISAWENERRHPSIPSLRKLAKALDCRPYEFIMEPEDILAMQEISTGINQPVYLDRLDALEWGTH